MYSNDDEMPNFCEDLNKSNIDATPRGFFVDDKSRPSTIMGQAQNKKMHFEFKKQLTSKPEKTEASESFQPRKRWADLY